MLASLPTDLQIDLGTDGCNVGTLGPVNGAAATILKICSGNNEFFQQLTRAAYQQGLRRSRVIRDA